MPAGAAITLAAVISGPAFAATASELLQEVQASVLSAEGAVRVSDLEIPLGAARLMIEEALLFPATPIAGHTAEIVLTGRAVFMAEPPDRVEAAQLELFTGGPSLIEPIEQAVLVLADEAAVDALLRGGKSTVPDASASARADSLFRAWKSGTERRRFGVDRALVRDALGDAAMAGFFAAWLESPRLGRFCWAFDSKESEPYVLGRFVRAELGDHQADVIQRKLRKLQREGRSRGVRLEDIGYWDTWMDVSRPEATGPPRPGASFEPVRYTLDVTLAQDAEHLRGRGRVDLRLEGDGLRAVDLELLSDFRVLAVRDVRDGRGGALEWIRAEDDLTVILPEPGQKGDSFALEIEWTGVAFDERRPGVVVLRDTGGWYPHGGSIGRASYDVTFRWPKRFELLAPGRVAEQGESDGARWARHLVEVPSSGFTFEMGAFELHREKVGHVDLVIGFTRDPGIAKEVRERCIVVLRESLRHFEEVFGSYPLDRLVAVSVPREFSQGRLGILTLQHDLLLPLQLASDQRDALRTEVLAHEMAHQWWGNKVGWISYRDQWLSEALADYAASRFTFRHLGRDLAILLRQSAGWRKSLTAMARSGRSLESMGPVVMGYRLASSLAPDAYEAIVYKKGALVFDMLARQLGEEPFLAMLKSLSDTVSHRAIDTPTFLKALEHMSGVRLEDFAARFLYGTGIPEVRYRYAVEPAEDGWLLLGEARMALAGVHRFRTVRVGAEGWDVVRERLNPVGVGESVLVVPFQVSVEGGTALPAAPTKTPFRKPLSVEKGLGGVVRLQGASSRFEISLESKPKALWLDQRGEVLAFLQCENREPKRTLREEAESLASAGETGRAEETFRLALAAPLQGPEELDEKLDERQTRIQAGWEDAHTHLGLARLYVDQGRDQDAVAALDSADAILRGPDSLKFSEERDLLRSRLEVRRGEFRRAYDRLARALTLYFRQREDDTTVDQLRRRKFADGREGTVEEYLLLAIAARGSGEGNEKVFRRALEEAKSRGADVSTLESEGNRTVEP